MEGPKLDRGGLLLSFSIDSRRLARNMEPWSSAVRGAARAALKLFVAGCWAFFLYFAIDWNTPTFYDKWGGVYNVWNMFYPYSGEGACKAAGGGRRAVAVAVVVTSLASGSRPLTDLQLFSAGLQATCKSPRWTRTTTRSSCSRGCQCWPPPWPPSCCGPSHAAQVGARRHPAPLPVPAAAASFCSVRGSPEPALLSSAC